MNGLPKLKVSRSISLYGLSDVRLTFADGTDNYFARQQVFERLGDIAAAGRRDAGHLAAHLAVGPRVSLRAREPRSLGDGAQDPPGLGARQSVPLGARRRRPLVARRRDDAVSGARRSRRSSPAPVSPSATSPTALGANNGNAGGGFYSEGGQFFYVRGLGRVEHARGHRQHRPRGAERHAGAREGRRRRRDRTRAAARPVRLHDARTTPSRASS